MSSFFTAPISQKKRKRIPKTSTDRPSKRRSIDRDDVHDKRPVDRRNESEGESISGSGSEEEIQPDDVEDSDATSEEGETAAERRIRLAQRYLDNLRQEVDTAGFDAEDVDRDLIAQRLKQDVDEAKGRQFRLLAPSLDFARAQHTFFRANTLSTTAVAICKPYAYTVSKDRTLIQWQLMPAEGFSRITSHANGKSKPSRRKPRQVAYVRGVKIQASSPHQHGHTGAILSVAASPDGKYVTTGGADKKLIIWSTTDLRPLKTFTTHRDAVTSLSFAPTTSTDGYGAQLFSASADRSIKTYSLAAEDSLAYVETLFGHQDHVLAISAMSVDQCVSVGARDRTARLWRVVDETQLKFLGDSSKHEVYQTGSLDSVAALPPQHFVTGSDAGAISLWSIHKKKSLFTVQTAHGVEEPAPLEDVTSETNPTVLKELKRLDKRRPVPRAITALVALPGTDIVLSGSWDGWIRVWKVSDDKRTLISMGILSGSDTKGQAETNGLEIGVLEEKEAVTQVPPTAGPVKGIINSLAILERRKEIPDAFGGKKEGDCLGLCIVAGIGKEPRLGRWMTVKNGKNGAMVFEVPLLQGINTVDVM